MLTHSVTHACTHAPTSLLCARRYWKDAGVFLGEVIASDLPRDSDGVAVLMVRYEDGEEHPTREEDVREGMALLVSAPPVMAPTVEWEDSRFIGQQVKVNGRTLTVVRGYKSRPDLKCDGTPMTRRATFICKVCPPHAAALDWLVVAYPLPPPPYSL